MRFIKYFDKYIILAILLFSAPSFFIFNSFASFSNHNWDSLFMKYFYSINCLLNLIIIVMIFTLLFNAKERKIILENKKRGNDQMINRNSRQNKHEQKDKRKECIK
jgi:hypothetical protein